MICQRCLEEYEFEGFKYDFKTNRAFGNFVCGCEEKLVLPEEDCIQLGLLDDDSREQLRRLKLLGISRNLESGRDANQVYLKALRAHESVLLRYLADVSTKGLLVR